jgi:hypothetical protein
MDVAFFMGLVSGVFIGLGFSLFVCKHVKKAVYEAIVEALNTKKTKRKEDILNEDEEEDWWKPKGWRPDDE